MPARFLMWAAAAVVAVGAATGAVAAASSGRGSNVLSQDDVASALAADSARGSDGAPGPDDTRGPGDDATGPTPSPGGATVPDDLGVFRAGKGGTVVVACDGDLARLVSWSPAQGYRADHAVRGPAAKASIEFESDTDDDVTVVVTCAAGAPTVQPFVDFDDHGGDDHGGGSGSGGSSHG